MTYSEAKEAFSTDVDERATQIETFANWERPSIANRLRAAKTLAKNREVSGAQRLQNHLLLARLQAVADTAANTKKRARTLKAAKKLARKLEDKATAKSIEKVLIGDAALRRLQRVHKKAAKRRMKAARQAAKKAKKTKKNRKGKNRKNKKTKSRTKTKTKTTSKTVGKSGKKSGGDDVKVIKRTLSAWEEISDTPQLARARLALLLAKEPRARGKAAREKLANKASSLAEGLQDHRDFAFARTGAWSLAARLLFASKMLKLGVKYTLQAERASRPPLKKAWPAGPRDRFSRSATTARLCRDLVEKRVLCAQIEEDEWGERSFYDFSRQKDRRFNQNKASYVLQEFDSLLKGCIGGSEQLTELDTEVSFSWMVAPTGRVTEYTVRPRRLEAGAFRACTDAAFDTFRYPRFKGPPASVGYAVDVDLADAKLRP